MEIKDAVTLVLATIGAVLGVFNAWRNWIKDRVRVRLEVTSGFIGESDGWVFLNIRNLSDFPITITRVGFHMRRKSGMQMQILMPRFTGGETLPVRLESRTACTVATQPSEHPANISNIRNAYVGTACGLTIKGGKRFFNDQRAAAAAQHTPGTD